MAEHLAHLISTSLSFGVAIALLLPLRRALDGRFAPTWWRRVWTWLLAVMFLALPARSLLDLALPTLIQVDTPQAVVDGAYDRVNGYARDSERGTEGGTTAVAGDGGLWSHHYVRYEDARGRDVTIRDNDYLRRVTVDGETTYTVHWTGIAVLLYGVGAALLFVGGLVRYRLFRRRCLRWSTPAGPEDLAALAEQKKAAGLKREVELCRCSLVHTPLLMGFLRPVILLPDGMPQTALDTALAHELTHWKARDTARLLWASLVRSIHWFNPMVWLLVRQLRQEVELCCDYALLKTRDAAGRRAYGQAILDQMTAGDRGLSRLTTGFSGGKREAFARFRAIMDTSPKRRGRTALAAALAVVVLAGSLVGCQTGASVPEGDGVWIAGLDLEEYTVTYYPLSRGLIADEEALLEWLWGADGRAAEEPRTVPLSGEAQFLHTYEGASYSIPPATLQASLAMSQAGELGQVELEGDEAVRVQLASAASLDLSASGLDFTGWCGSVYAAGMGGARLLHGREALSVDPCTEGGSDGDHTYYALPLAPDAAISEVDRPFLTGLASAQYPSYWRLTLVDGQVTAVGRVSGAAMDILDTMSTLQGADIADLSYSGGPVSVGWLERLDREELAQLVRLAADQPLAADRALTDEDVLDYGLWTLELHLTNGETISLYAGRAENQISVTEPVCLDGCPKLYQLIRTATDSAQVVSVTDSEILSVMNEVLSDTLALWRTPGYAEDYGASYQEIRLTRLERPALPESLGEGVELYAYDFGLVVDDLFHVQLAGAPWVDSQLRCHPGGNSYLAVERAEDGSVARWGAFCHEGSPPFDRREPEGWDAFASSARSALERGGVE